MENVTIAIENIPILPSKCPDCGEHLVYDANSLGTTASLIIHVYCSNDDCDYYDGKVVNVLTGEVNE